MGLSEPAVAPAATGILDPRTGRPVGADDRFFVEVNNELADKGFFVTATDELIHSWYAHAASAPLYYNALDVLDESVFFFNLTHTVIYMEQM